MMLNESEIQEKKKIWKKIREREKPIVLSTKIFINSPKKFVIVQENVRMGNKMTTQTHTHTRLKAHIDTICFSLR